MHCRLGSATLSQLPFPGESNLNFSWVKSKWGNKVVKNKQKQKNPQDAAILVRSLATKIRKTFAHDVIRTSATPAGFAHDITDTDRLADTTWHAYGRVFADFQTSIFFLTS